MLPETHYLTMLDQFGVSVLVQQMLILVAVCVEQRHLLRQADEIDERLVQRQDDELFIACGLITGCCVCGSRCAGARGIGREKLSYGELLPCTSLDGKRSIS